VRKQVLSSEPQTSSSTVGRGEKMTSQFMLYKPKPNGQRG
jgi:hypothetical protein